MDELPILVNRLLKGVEKRMTPERVRQADAFVSFLRAQSIQHKSAIRFVIAGSIGLQPVLRQAGLSASVNTFTPFELGPWDAYTAIGCIEALAAEHKLRLESGVPQKMVALLGSCVPHHVQVFFNHLYIDARRGGVDQASIEDVERVYKTSMLSSRGHVELSHFVERLEAVLDADILPLALDMLTEAAVTGYLSVEAIETLSADYIQEPSRRIGFQGNEPDGGASRVSFGEVARGVLDIFEHDGLSSPGRRAICFRFRSREGLVEGPV
jgi:hypothetical protein